LQLISVDEPVMKGNHKQFSWDEELELARDWLNISKTDTSV